jgi:hypothetical protein
MGNKKFSCRQRITLAAAGAIATTTGSFWELMRDGTMAISELTIYIPRGWNTEDGLETPLGWAGSEKEWNANYNFVLKVKQEAHALLFGGQNNKETGKYFRRHLRELRELVLPGEGGMTDFWANTEGDVKASFRLRLPLGAFDHTRSKGDIDQQKRERRAAEAVAEAHFRRVFREQTGQEWRGRSNETVPHSFFPGRVAITRRAAEEDKNKRAREAGLQRAIDKVNVAVAVARLKAIAKDSQAEGRLMAEAALAHFRKASTGMSREQTGALKKALKKRKDEDFLKGLMGLVGGFAALDVGKKGRRRK